jgi:hypothetical protein
MRDPVGGGETAQNVAYELSADNTILAVSSEWDRVALAQDAPRCTGAHLVGRRLWDSVNGPDTMSYLNALLFSCRAQLHPIRSIYR